MIKYALFALLLIHSATVYCQSPLKIETYTLPVHKFDSLVFRAIRGNSCEVLKDSLQIRVLSLSDLNTAKDKRITLKVAEIKNLAYLDSISTVRFDKAQNLYIADKSALKQKIKRKNRIILGEGGVIAILLLALLL